MALRTILTVGDPLLRMPARRVRPEALRDPDTQRLIDDLIETMIHANGAGLAAPQIGWPVQIAAVCVRDNPRYPYKPNIPLTVFVNPVITPRADDQAWINEGCLSVPGWRGEVARFMKVTVDALDRYGAPMKFDVSGLTAATYQHEFDHLEGRLFLDRVEDSTTFMSWSNFESVHRKRFELRARNIVLKYGQ
jgi:peptide deformylase